MLLAPGIKTFFAPVKWRSIGPFRGGRPVAATGVVDDTKPYYIGTTGGGVCKTVDKWITWKNISDGFFTTGSVSAIAVSESDPNVVYVGMGKHAVRGGMTHHGNSVYRSTDAGRTWKKVGFAATQHIARIPIRLTNPDIVWVAAQGALYGAGAERVQVDGRGRELDEGALRQRPDQRVGSRHGRFQPEDSVRGRGGARPPGDVPVIVEI